MKTPRLRTIGEFAEDEIILPDGPFAGRRFRLDRHPVARLLFAELDSGRWARAFITGPNQDGKSLLGFVIPTLYLLFERMETVILGVPSLDIVADKWVVDLLPVIQASRYASQLPANGKGSRDGESVLFSFANGARLRFMTAGGNDQSRAGFTSQNLVVTETDGFDVVGGNSREGDKFSQLERRTLAFADRGSRTIAECTVSFETGRTWQEYNHGSKSRIALKCPHCAAWVTPDRPSLTGWQAAETEIEAIAKACVACPDCGATWTNEQRIEANHGAVLVHKEQGVAPDGTITGEMPQTNTLGFRWTVVNCVLNPKRLSIVAGIEWRARRAADEDAAERDVSQSQWALPAQAAKVDLSQLDAFAIMRRTLQKRRGICPDDTQCITVGIDIGKRLCHWTAIAWRPNATPHIVDYGRLEPPSDQMGEEEAIMIALRDFKDDTISEGWKCGERIIKPTFALVDRGNWSKTIQRFTTESGLPFFAAWGYGIGQRRDSRERRESGAVVIWTKDGYSLIREQDGNHYLEIKVNQWKTWLHARINTPMNQAGALTLFEFNDHLSFAKHLTAEKKVEQFVPKEGMVTTWEAVSKNNHYLDATMMACVGGYEAGMRLIDAPVVPQRQPLKPRERTESPWLGDTSNWRKQ